MVVAVEVSNRSSLDFLASATSAAIHWAQAHTPALFHSDTSLSLFLWSVFFLLSLSSSLGPLLHPLPLLCFLKSLSFYSLLLCCIPASVEKGVDKEEGGKKRKGELEL